AAQAAAEQEAAAAEAARVAEEEAARLAQEAAAAAEQEAAAQAAAEQEAIAAEAARVAEEEAARIKAEAAAVEALETDAERPLDAREERRRERERRRDEPAAAVEQPAQIAPMPSQPEAVPVAPVPEAAPQEIAPTNPASTPVGEAVPAAGGPTDVREERRPGRERRREERREEPAGAAGQPDASVPSTVAAEPVPAEASSPPTAAPADAAGQNLPAAGQPATDREGRREERERRQQDREGAPTVSQPSSVTSPPGVPPVDARDERRRARELRRENRGSAPAPAVAPAATATTTVEQQLQIQGGSEELDELRRLQRKLEREREQVGASQSGDGFETGAQPDRRQQRQERRRDGVALERHDGGVLRGDDRAEGRRERRNDRGDRGEIVERQGDRIIIQLGNQLIIQPEQEGDRLLSRARDVEVEDLGNGETLTTVFRRNGVRVETVRNAYGDILLRTRVLPNGDEIVLIDNLGFEERQPDQAFGDHRYYAEISPLPPLVIAIPQEEYVVETRVATRLQVEAALTAPPVEEVERIYSLDEVRYSHRLRDKVRRVDLDTITFAFGSAVVGLEELDALDSVGLAIEETIANSPDEIFLIEGHTDAIGSDEANLLLSDRRAEAVAVALSEDFDIPPENLVTQGYGEQHLKLQTIEAERENRRVAIRRITPLIRAAR
ncbi:MAG: OmpA family protein, partial [Aurantimonas endophytica]|uniref:OmpA family protein n=1 Tax=Aurantimonas endophytica TaxID=1522175 RepID=UPI003001BC91